MTSTQALRSWWDDLPLRDLVPSKSSLSHPYETGDFPFVTYQLHDFDPKQTLPLLSTMLQSIPKGWTPCFLGTLEDWQEHLIACQTRRPGHAIEQGRWIAQTLRHGESLADILEGESKLSPPGVEQGMTMRFDLATGEEAERHALPHEVLKAILAEDPAPYPRTMEDPAEMILGFFPTSKPWTIPAYLNPGSINANPNAGEHAGVWEFMAHRYQVTPYLLTPSAVEMVSEFRPSSWAEGFELAQFHFDYCTDLLDMGYDSLREVAGHLKRSGLWSFVWH